MNTVRSDGMDWLTRQAERLRAEKQAQPSANRRGNDSTLGLDPITGFANRRLFQFQGEKAFSMAQRHSDDLGLVVFRIENLDEIAIRKGVPAARTLLAALAGQLQGHSRSCDTGGRLSRTRFGMLLPGAREFGAHKYAVRLMAILQNASDESDACAISAAAAATSGQDFHTFSALRDHTSERLQAAVSAGGNRLVSSFCQ